jgi:hypothetical protein
MQYNFKILCKIINFKGKNGGKYYIEIYIKDEKDKLKVLYELKKIIKIEEKSNYKYINNLFDFFGRWRAN